MENEHESSEPATESGDRRRPSGFGGADPTLVEWFLTLTPAERVRTIENYAASIRKIRESNDTPENAFLAEQEVLRKSLEQTEQTDE